MDNIAWNCSDIYALTNVYVLKKCQYLICRPNVCVGKMDQFVVLVSLICMHSLDTYLWRIRSIEMLHFIPKSQRTICIWHFVEFFNDNFKGYTVLVMEKNITYSILRSMIRSVIIQRNYKKRVCEIHISVYVTQQWIKGIRTWSIHNNLRRYLWREQLIQIYDERAVPQTCMYSSIWYERV